MGWLELTVAARAEAVDWVAALVAGTGHAGSVDVLPTPAGERPFALRLHVPDDRSGRSAANRVHDALDPLRRMGLVGDLEVEDVVEPPPPAPLPPRRLTDRFWVLPPGAPDPPDGGLPLRLAPGPAFGSGLHPATVAVLRLIERHARPGLAALDLGCGSGILSLALARLGLGVLAVDNDPVAVEATHQAVGLNGLDAAVEVACASLGPATRLGHWLGLGDVPEAPPVPTERRFDILVANILSRVHGALADEYRRVLREDGCLVVGGFTVGEDEAEVAAALDEARLVRLDRTRLGDYVALAYRPKPV